MKRAARPARPPKARFALTDTAQAIDQLDTGKTVIVVRDTEADHAA